MLRLSQAKNYQVAKWLVDRLLNLTWENKETHHVRAPYTREKVSVIFFYGCGMLMIVRPAGTS